MPVVLAPLFVAAGLTGTITIGATTVATAVIAANIAFTALTVGAQVAMSSIQRQQAKRAARRNSSTQDYKQSIRGSVAARTRHYGEVKVGGAVLFIENVGSDVYQLVVFGTGTISGYQEFYIGDRRVLIDADGAVTNAPYWIGASASPDARSHVRLESRRGFASQPASTILQDAFPGVWTAAHRLNGAAWIASRYRAAAQNRFADIYNSTIPALSAVVRGAPIWDQRAVNQSLGNADTWTYSENPALVLYDYLVNTDGMGVNPAAIDLESFRLAANYCDEFVPLKNGGSERRYRFCGSYSFDETPAEISQRMLDAMSGEMFLTRDGKFGLLLNRWIEPSVTLTEEDVIALSLERSVGLLRQYNAARPIYTSAAHGYQEIEAAEVIDDEAEAELGRVIANEVRLPGVPSHAQAQRLAKIELYQDNPEYTGDVTATLRALDLLPSQNPDGAITGRIFRLKLDRLEIDLVCRVTRFTLGETLASCTLGFETVDPRAYDWVASRDEGDEPLVPVDTSDDATQPGPPSGFVVVTETLEAVTRSGVRWNAKDRAGQLYDVRWNELLDPVTEVTGLTEKHYDFATTEDDDYRAEARVRTTAGGISAYTGLNFTATPFTETTLAPPSALTVTAGAGTVEIRATSSPDIEGWSTQHSIVSVGAPAAFGASVGAVRLPAAPVVINVAAAAGAYHVFVRARSLLGGLVSSAVGPVLVTVLDSGVGGGSGTDGTGGDGSGGPGAGNTGSPGGTPGDGSPGSGVGDGTGGLY